MTNARRSPPDRGALLPRAAHQRALVLAVSLACWSCGSPEPNLDVRRATRDGVPLRWEKATLQLTVQSPPAGSPMTQGELLGAAHLAAKAWKSSCSALDFDITAAPQQSRVQRDGINSVTIRSRRWCPDDAMRNRDCHDPKLHALTVLHKLPPASAAAEARIAEADIELNAVHFEWTPERLQAVMVHELGHLLGLDHPCGYRPSGSDSRTGALQPAAECNAYQNQAMHPDPLAADAWCSSLANASWPQPAASIPPRQQRLAPHQAGLGY